MIHPTLSLLLVSACGFSTGGSADPDEVFPGTLDAAETPEAGDHARLAPVALGTAGTYAILAKSGISGTVGAVIGDIGVSPAAATYITGFSLSADATNMFSTSAQITGRVYAASYVAPTPAKLTLAVADMEVAFTDAAARVPETTELGGGSIGGRTLPPGSYAWTTAVTIGADVTLHGDAADVWILQVTQALTMTAGTHVILSGGALAKNVFWQITGGPVTLAAGADLRGVVLAKTAVTLAAGASVHGRLLAQTYVDIDGSTVAAP